MIPSRWPLIPMCVAGAVGLFAGWLGGSLSQSPSAPAADADAVLAAKRDARMSAQRDEFDESGKPKKKAALVTLRAFVDGFKPKGVPAMFYSRGFGGGYQSFQVYNPVTGSLPLADVKRLLEELVSEPDSKEKKAARAALTARWASLKPHEVITAYGRQPNSPEVVAALTVAITTIAPDDPVGAMDQANAASAALGKDWENVIVSIIQQSSGTQPELAWRILQQTQVKGGQYSYVKTQVLQSWLAKDVDAAWPIIQALPPGQERRNLVAQMAVKQGENDPRAGVAWAEALENPAERQQALTGVMTSWAQRDTAAALAYIETQPPSRGTDQVFSVIVQTMGQEDPAAATQWALSIGRENAQRNALYTSLSYWAQKDPAAAAAFVAANIPEKTAGQYMSNVISTWVQRDPAAAIQFAETAPDKMKPNLISQAVNTWARSDARAAAAYVSQMPAGDARTEATNNIVSQLANDDASSAAAWLQSQPAAAGKLDNAYSNVVSNWFEVDPAGASSWITSLPAGENRDAAASSFAQRAAQEDPVAAMQWANEVGDQSKRRNQQSYVLRQWMEKDKPAAQAWVRTSSHWTKEQIESIVGDDFNR